MVKSISDIRETELQFRELAKTAAQFERGDRVAESQREPSSHTIEITDDFFEYLNELLCESSA